MKAADWKKSICRFLAAQTISLLGSSIVQYSIIWHITLTTSSGRMLTASTLCGFLPQVIISLYAGVWIDRYNRKMMIMLSDAAIAAATLLLALSLLAGHNSVWLLYTALIVRSAGTGIQSPAVNAVLPQLVPKEKLMKINGINSTLSSMILFVSPALSGALLSVAPLEASLFLDVLTAVTGIGITATVFIPPYDKKAAVIYSALYEIKNGFHYLKDNRFIKKLFFYQIAVLFLISPSAFLTPLMVSRTFGQEVWRLTASEMTYSIGMILGGLLIASWGGFQKRMDTTLTAGASYGILMLGLGTAPVFIIYLACNALIGITSPCYNAPITVTIQERVSPDMLGRVFSIMQIASSCALPLGMVFFGPLADIIPVRLLLVLSGSIVFILSCLARLLHYFDEEKGPGGC